MSTLLSTAQSRDVADSLWAIDWISETDGFLTCPGEGRHTSRSARRDCRIMLEGGKPPTIHCLHASCASEVQQANFTLRSALGKAESALNSKEGWKPDPSRPRLAPKEPEEPPSYDEEKLTSFAGSLAREVDAAWLANRSVIDPSDCTSHDFLSALYHPERGERVLVFTEEYSQGEAVWPDAKVLPDRGPCGVWFLAQPVTGEYQPNPRSEPPGKPSRRIAECVLSWRYLLLESDNAPARLWLGAVAQLPLRIAAIYTSGSRSIHVLVQVDAPVKEVWEREKAALLRGMVTLGACRGSLSGVRLTRLPGCWRFGKQGEEVAPDGSKRRRYMRYDSPGLQKLLYLSPNPSARPIASVVPRRDVLPELRRQLADVSKRAMVTPAAELEQLRRRLAHFEPIAPEFTPAIEELKEIINLVKGGTL